MDRLSYFEETMLCDECEYRYEVHEVHLVESGAQSPKFLCTWCKEKLEREEDCTCVCVGDSADARGCAVHGDVRMPAILVEAGVTRAEGEAFLSWIERKPAKVERMQGELFPEVA